MTRAVIRLTVSRMRTGYVTSKVDSVRRMPAFSGCSDEEIIDLTREADELDVRPGQVLMVEGDSAGEIFLILSGRVSVRSCGAEIGQAGPGETVGEMAMIDPGPRSATVVAETPVRALVFGPRHLHGLLGQAGPVRAVASILASRLRDADAELTEHLGAGRDPRAGRVRGGHLVPVA